MSPLPSFPTLLRPTGIVLVLCAALALDGCNTTAGPAADADTGQVKERPVATRPFPTDTLYDLLVAEFAASRGHADIALQNYMRQAQQTRDLGIVQRAALIAQYLGDDLAVQEIATIWSSISDSAEPDALIAASLMKQGKFAEAFDQSLKLQAHGYQPAFQAIAAQAVASSPAPDRAALEQLLARFDAALQSQPDNSQLMAGKALLIQALGDDKQALVWANKAIDADGDNGPVYLLQAALVEKLQGPQAAATILARRLHNAPDDRHLRLQYARTLTRFDLSGARREFATLLEQDPLDENLLLSLALVNKELGDMTAAKEYLEQLLALQKYSSTAYFYLGQISEKDNDIPRALEFYRRAFDGNEQLYAYSAFCRLLASQQRLGECRSQLQQDRARQPQLAQRLFLLEADILLNQEQAAESLALVNRALEQFPNDNELLYSRSMAHDQLNDLAASEQDLRAILAVDNNNVTALNALGYILANKTDRLEEAHGLIARALAAEPKNPAILDSMGWVLYRQHRTEEALPYLREAMSLYPNHEIAAHLGEVLWVTGKQDEARQVWKKGIDDNPDSPVIKETLERLGAR